MFNECTIIAVKLIIQIREKGTRKLHLSMSGAALISDIYLTLSELQLSWQSSRSAKVVWASAFRRGHLPSQVRYWHNPNQ
jgi:hypothetical protein